MLFNSFQFLFLFFPICTGIFFLTPYHLRWLILLLSSYTFYAFWRTDYLTLILLSTCVDYIAGIRMGKIADKAARRPWLFLSLVSNLGLLFIFKYLGFFEDCYNSIACVLDPGRSVNLPNLILPVGISFYTFQTLAYSIDVYRGHQQPERHFGFFALYVSFWPQLVAGPIERSQNLLPQLRERHFATYENFVCGFRFILWGLFLKIAMADRLGIAVNEIYNNPDSYGTGPILVGTLFFSFQIYGDFAGYSLIAIGCARTLGIELMWNFHTPYFSRSISEFWRRWHISLSTWFKDYLYIPLGGNRVRARRLYANLLIVFIVSGLWHGANWTFIAWGALHGLYIATEIWSKATIESIRKRLKHQEFDLNHSNKSGSKARPSEISNIKLMINNAGTTLLTFSLVTFSWLFFRSNSVRDSMTLLNEFNPLTRSLEKKGMAEFFETVGIYNLALSTVTILTTISIDKLTKNGNIHNWLNPQPIIKRWIFYSTLTLFIVFFGAFGNRQFIYFQF